MAAWQARLLDALYAAIFVDAIVVKIRDARMRWEPLRAIYRRCLTVWVPITLSQALTWSLCWMRGGQVKHLTARGPHGRALSVLVSMRFAYLAVLRVFGVSRVMG